LPFVLIFMLLLINKKDLMGEYVNSRLFNVVAWSTTVLVIALTLILMWQSLHSPTGAMSLLDTPRTASVN
jgi:Mn2+/Fe2+ NRAMP family transporter